MASGSGSGATVTVNVQANTQNAQQQIGYLRTMMNQFGTEVTNRFTAIFSAVAVVKMGFDKVTEAMQHNLAVAKQISSLSTKFHIDPKEVHSLMMSAEQAGVSVRSLLMGMKALGSAAAKAVVNKDFANVFKQMGMDAKNLGDMASKPAKSFAEVAVKLSEIASETIRAEVGTKLLGRSYQQLAPLIDKLADSEEERQKLLNNPNAMNSRQVGVAKDYVKQQAEMKEGFESTVAQVMPLLSVIAAAVQLSATGIMLLFNWAVHRFSSGESQTKLANTYETSGGDKADDEITAKAWTTPVSERTREQERTTRDGSGYGMDLADSTRVVKTGWTEADEKLLRVVGYYANTAGSEDPLKKALASNSVNMYDPQRVSIHAGETELRGDTEAEKRERFKKALDAMPKDANGDIDTNTPYFQRFASEDVKNGMITIAKLHNARRKSDPNVVKGLIKGIQTDGDRDYNDRQEELMRGASDAMYRVRNSFDSKDEWVKDPASGVWKLQSRDYTAGRPDLGPEKEKDVLEEARQKKVNEKLVKRSRLASRSLEIANKGGEDEGVERAEIGISYAKMGVTDAVEKNEEKKSEVESAKVSVEKTQENVKVAREAYEKDLALRGETGASKELQEKLKVAIDEVVKAKRALNAANNEAVKSETEVTDALAKEKEAENALKKAKDARVAKDMHDTNEALKHDENQEKKAFDRRMKDAKLQGKTQQEVGEETLEFEKKRLEEQARLYEFAKSEAERRKAENGGELQKADEDELKRQQAAFEAAQDRVHEAIYALAQNDTGQATDMRKMGGGGAVFGGASNVGMTAVEANRRKIPLLEKIEKNTRPDTGGINGGTPVDSFPKYGENNYAQT